MRLFGTNGVRGLVGTTMTPQLALGLGQAVGTWLKAGDRVAVGRDARASGPMIQSAFMAGLQSTGVHAVDVGIQGSPAIQLYVRDKGFAAGGIITASHNPPEWNGIKLVAPDGTETERHQEAAVEEILASGEFRTANWNSVGTLSTDDGAANYYIDAVLSQVDVNAIRAAKLKVVLDPGGGAGCVASPILLERLGVEMIPLSCELDGAFSDRPSEPTEVNAQACIAAVKEHKADLGCLHDGDADRAVFIDENGGYIWGDTTLSLAALHELPRHEEKSFCTAVSSSSCVEDAVKAAGGHVIWTPVGSPIVARAMIEANAQFGGEDNGGLMFTRHQICRDGMMALAFMCERIAVTGRSMSELLSDIPKYALVKRKVAVPDDEKAPLLAALQTAAGSLTDAKSVDGQDGVKVYLEDGWALVRPSGTEAIFRIQAEAKDGATAEAIATRFERLLADLRQRVAAN